MANTYKNIVITPNRDTDAANVPFIRFSGGDAASNTDINVRVYTTQSGTLSFEGSAGQLFSITNDLTNSIFSVNDVSGIPSIDVNANGDIFLAPFGGQLVIGNAANLNFDSTSSTKIVEPAANTLAFHTTQAERLRIDSSGNLLIGRADSNVGQNVKLDVNGGINSSVILSTSGNIASSLTVAQMNVVPTIQAAFAAANAAVGGSTDAFARNTANAGFDQANTARTHANAAHLTANAAFNRANTANQTADLAFGQANTALTTGQAAFGRANTANQTADLAFGQANTARSHANAAHLTANAAFDQANTARTHANTAHLTANAGFDQANTARTHANAAHLTANAAFNRANTANQTADLAFGQANTALTAAQAAFGRANTANQTADLAFGQANTARTHANAAHLTANAGFVQANTARDHANAAFNAANTAPGSAYYNGNNGERGLAAGLGDIFRVHTNVLTGNVTINSGNNSLAAGPITVANNRTLIIQANARVSIV